MGKEDKRRMRLLVHGKLFFQFIHGEIVPTIVDGEPGRGLGGYIFIRTVF
jgi:hypothetical protein